MHSHSARRGNEALIDCRTKFLGCKNIDGKNSGTFGYLGFMKAFYTECITEGGGCKTERLEMGAAPNARTHTMMICARWVEPSSRSVNADAADTTVGKI